jgi:hypothetical protein
MSIKIILRNVEMDGDAESVNVHLEIYQMQSRNSIPLRFKVKKTGSLDAAVQTALEQLRTFAAEFYTAANEPQPI